MIDHFHDAGFQQTQSPVAEPKNIIPLNIAVISIKNEQVTKPS